jgi:Asp-tRNA(Asn)/Glu-tRNA(Gln) amidotransferase A subunit family amidase
VKAYKTTWGSDAYKEQTIDQEARVVEMLREAGAVLIAKLTTGELAQGDQWFGGQTKNPWNTAEGSSGSSAGPCSATAADCVAFGIGSETSGSILSPSARCGITGLRPAFGRVSRYGVMTLSWTQDRLGPLCRYSEDCAIVMSVITKPDGRDLSVSELPFNWNSRFDFGRLQVGYLKGRVRREYQSGDEEI